MFEERLSQIQSETTATDKYFVIRYNCWKYDYYEEPLIAIVSELIAVIEEKTALFPDGETKRKILNTLKAVGNTMLYISGAVLEAKMGIDICKVKETFLGSKKSSEEKYEQEHNYDMYFAFNKVMDKLIGILQEIAQKYTVIIIVDELDRCLPEYAIKVLERLHHLTENLGNTITTIAIDKKQLMSSVKHAFGFENPEKYLEKFVEFEIKLDNGITSDKVMEKYKTYLELFDKSLFPFEESVEECLQAIFKNIDIRSQEQIIKKAMLVHKLLYKGIDKKDYSFMCMELIIAVMIFAYNWSPNALKNVVDVNGFENVFAIHGSRNKPAFAQFFKEKFEKIRFTITSRIPNAPTGYMLPNNANLYGAIIFSWYWMHRIPSSITIQHMPGDVYEVVAQNNTDLKFFVKMVYLMR